VTLGFAYMLGFVLATTTALLTVLSGAQLPAWMWLAVLMPVVSALQQARGKVAPTWVGTLTGGLSVVYAAATLQRMGTDGVLIAMTGALLGIFLARLVTRATLKHDLQALMLSLLVVIAGAGMNAGVSYGVAFVFYAVSIVWALVTRQLVEGAEREAELPFGARLEVTLARRDIVTPVFFGASAMVSLVVLLSTSLLFVLFPRVGLGNFKLGSGGGLPDDISLRGSPMAEGSSTVVARLRGIGVDDFNRGLYMRAATYDGITREGFDRNEGMVALASDKVTKLAHQQNVHVYEVFLQPVTDNHLLLLGPADAVNIGGANPSSVFAARSVSSRPNGEVLALTNSAVRYSVAGSTMLQAFELDPSATADIGDELKPWLRIPDDLNPRIAQLAADTIGAAKTSYAKASALRRMFATQFSYTLDLPNGRRSDPLSSFLFEDRRGHCEYFATAYAAMLRTIGIPARVVGGYAGGTWDPESELVIFTDQDAHAWVEWYAPGAGWVTDDATPASDRGNHTLSGIAAVIERMRRTWDDYVLDYGLSQQFQIFAQVSQGARHLSLEGPEVADRRTLAIIAAICVSIVGGVWFWRRRHPRERKKLHPLARALQQTLTLVLGAPVNTTATLRESVSDATRKLGSRHELANALAMALAVYERQRFGLMRGAGDDAPRALRALKTATRHYRA
jgi:hypothetical protein